MIHGLLELTDHLGMDYYFVSVLIKKETMEITNYNAYCKLIKKKLHLAEIEQLVFFELKGISHVSFDYNHEHYCFTDYDNQIADSLKAKVFRKKINEPIY